MADLKPIHGLAFIFALLCLVPLPFAAALSGTGCTTGGDCYVTSNQTIDSGTSYYFNSLSIPSGVIVTISPSVSTAGGTVKFFVAGDAIIAGSVLANGGISGGSNPDGGGYAGASVNGAGTGGAGGGVIWIYAKNLTVSGTLSANGGIGPDTNNYPGGGSGGTVKLVGRSIIFSGNVAASGGRGSSTCAPGGGGAGGSIVFLPFEISSLSSGTFNANGGAGGSACGNTAQSGGGAGRYGGNSANGGYGGGGSGGIWDGTGGGPANPSRNVKIYNTYVPAGSSAIVSSTGDGSLGSGLLDLYNSPYNSKYSGLTYTLRPENFIAGVFGLSMTPVSSVAVKLVNSSNNSQVYYSGSTGSEGTVLTFQALPALMDFDVLAEPVVPSGLVFVSFGNASSYPAHSSTALVAYSQTAKVLVRKMNVSLFKPDTLETNTDFYVRSNAGGYPALNCFGYTSSSQDAYCLIPRTLLDSSRTRLNYSLYVNTSSYSNNLNVSLLQVPNSFSFGPASEATKLRGQASALLMKAGLLYKRRVFYSPTQLTEEGFAYTETIPTDFAFGPSATAYVSMAGQPASSCSFSAPATGKLIAFSQSNCPLLATPITSGDWVVFEYDVVAPQPDAFFGESKDYSFDQGSLQVSTSSS